MQHSKQPNPIIAPFLKRNPRVSTIIFKDAVFYKQNGKMYIEHPSEMYLNQMAAQRTKLEEYFGIKVLFLKSEEVENNS